MPHHDKQLVGASDPGARRLAAVIEASADGVLVVDESGEILLANPVAQALFGRTGDELTELPFGLPQAPRDRWTELRIMRDGEERSVDMRVTRIAWNGGFAFLATLRDITEATRIRRDLQTQQRRSKALATELVQAEQRERRRIAQLLHDEMQQLLVASKIRIELAQAICEPKDDGRHDGGAAPSQRNGDHLEADAVTRLRRHLAQAVETLETAIGASRQLTADLSPTVLYERGLVPAVRWLADVMESRYGFVTTIGGDESVDVDNDDLLAFMYSATRELLFNAVKHSGQEEATLTITRRGDDLRLIVEDRGKGFDRTAFDEGMDEGEPNSSGLGLFSLEQRIEAWRGRIELTTAPGQGTCVELNVRVPRRDAPEAHRFETSADHHPATRDSREPAVEVLLADDHRVVRAGVRSLLECEPDICVIAEAANGREACDQARRLQPDVIVMDMQMPVMNGIDAIRELRSRGDDVPIVVLTMFDERHLLDSAQTAGANACCTKGGDATELVNLIRELAGNGHHRPGQTVPV